MKKKHWIIGLVVLGVIGVGIGVGMSLWNNDDTSSTKQEDIYEKEEDETEFVPFDTEEDVSDEKLDGASEKTGASGSSNVGDSQTPSKEDSKEPSEEDSDTSGSGGTSDTPSDSPETDSDTEKKTESNTGTELPFVPFD